MNSKNNNIKANRFDHTPQKRAVDNSYWTTQAKEHIKISIRIWYYLGVSGIGM